MGSMRFFTFRVVLCVLLFKYACLKSWDVRYNVRLLGQKERHGDGRQSVLPPVDGTEV